MEKESNYVYQLTKGDNKMIRRHVVSSNVASIGYENGILEVEFNDGSVYHYFGATEGLFYEFLNAPSKGQFVHYVLKKHNYPYRRVA